MTQRDGTRQGKLKVSANYFFLLVVQNRKNNKDDDGCQCHAMLVA